MLKKSMIGSVFVIIICIISNVLCIKGIVSENINLIIQCTYFLLGGPDKRIWSFLFKNKKDCITVKSTIISIESSDIIDIIFWSSWIVLSLTWFTSFVIMTTSV